MAFDFTPWVVGGGATHSPEVIRNALYASTQGSEGIVAAADLKVAPLSTPGSSVRVLPGSGLVLNRANGGAQQTYAFRAPTETNVAIAATGSTAGRSDMVVVRVEDPFVAGSTYATPANPATAQYVFPRVLSNVPASAVASPEAARLYLAGIGAQSMIALGGVTLPASTGTVTGSHLTDLRYLALPRTSRELLSAQPTVAVLSSTTFVRWPLYNPRIVIPVWATWASIVATVSGAGVTSNVDGAARVRMGDLTGGNYIIDIDINSGAPTRGQRETLIISGSGFISATDRGRDVELVIEALRSGGSIGTNDGTHVIYDVQFSERKV